jgi:triacylglycerol lipase
MRNRFLLLNIALCCLLLLTVNSGFAQKKKNPAVKNAPAACDSSLLPVVMMHGFLGAGDTYSKQVHRFINNGYCRNRLFVYDWNSVAASRNNTQPLDSFINLVLQKTGAKRVELIGHSAGGGLGYSYLSDSSRAKNVAHYVHIASGKMKGPAGAVPTLNLWSEQDYVIKTGGDIPGATNIKIEGADHYEVATAATSFEAIYRFFNNGKQAKKEIAAAIPAAKNTSVSGRVLSMGDNKPQVNTFIQAIDLSRLDPDKPVNANGGIISKTDSGGNFNYKQLEAGKPWLFRVQPPGGRVVYYYREGFRQNESLVYFRSLPSAASSLSFVFNSIPRSKDQGAYIIFSSNSAFVAGRDTLMVNGNTLTTPEFAAADKTTVAFILYDNGNNTTDLKLLGNTNNFPFLKTVDLSFPVATGKQVSIYYNGRNILLPTIASADGVVVVVLD